MHITGRRSDGYHFLESLVVFTEYGDEIHVTEDRLLSLEIIGEFSYQLIACPKEENLVWKAAKVLQQNLPIAYGAKITLVKNLPVASGIGGGSADAAAVIQALTEIWKIDIASEKISKIALGLGSDVPVCLYGAPAIMRGVGDDIIPVTLKEKPYIVLINPGIAISTAEIFKGFAGSQYKDHIKLNDIISIKDISLDNRVTNVLEKVTREKIAVIGEILDSLRGTGGCMLARMSGSGATCFGLFMTEVEAKASQKIMRELYPQSWCIVTSIK